MMVVAHSNELIPHHLFMVDWRAMYLDNRVYVLEFEVQNGKALERRYSMPSIKREQV